MQNFFKSNVVDAARTQKIRIYIDALDECGEDVAIDLVEFFRCFAAPVSICFSCRHYPFVALEGGDEICVEDENDQDIKIYVQEKIQAHIRRTDIAGILQNEVVSRSRSNFQWVVLVIPPVLTLYKSGKSIASIQAMIQNIPTELQELYTGLLSRIEDQERAQSLHLMQWICFSFRPLTLRELRFALAINPDIPQISIHQCLHAGFRMDTDEDIEKVIKHLSKGLAEVQEHESKLIVQFIHQSVQDFLLETGLQVLDHSIAGNVIGHGHLWISRLCIEYLFMREVQTADSLGDSTSQMEKSDSLGLFRYSLTHWLSHIQKLEDANMSQDDLAALSIKVSDVTLPEHFVKHLIFDNFRRRPTFDTTLLHIVTQRHLINFTKAILTQTVRADRTDGRGRTSLSIAARKWHAILVELLLSRHDVDANHRDAEQNTSLSLAAARGREAVIKMLISRDDVDRNHKNSKGDTPLSSVAEEGHEVVMKLLLDRRDVDPSSINYDGHTPVFKAVRNGHTATVKMLLNREHVDVNQKDLQGDTPFWFAFVAGHTAMVEVLLRENANPNIRDKFNADIDAEDLMEDTPLSAAASKGYCKVVELLLQRINNADNIQLALFLATSHGHCEVVKFLLQRTNNADSIDESGRTPLSLAAKKGHCEMVELLLQRTSNVDNIDKFGRTPLSLAAGNGHCEMVELLLQRTSNADSIDKSGRTPLSLAAAMEIVRLLVQGTRTADSIDKSGRTPLSPAAGNGHCEMVELLLQRTSNIDNINKSLRTPLLHARRDKHKEKKILKEFVKRSEADVNSRDASGRIVWSRALNNFSRSDS